MAMAYGELGAPLVVALDAATDFTEDSDIISALDPSSDADTTR
jgi:hypothetical protein